MGTVDAIDGALEQFAKRGPEFGPGLSNHGPMAAEALIAMGRGKVVEPWAEWYVQRLDRPPIGAGNPITADDWREALGSIKRAGDWEVFFARELEQAPWQDVLRTWTPRLAPGIMAAATHGILRTAHAVRSLERGETPLRLHELALGLAYWAARYSELPGAPSGSPGTAAIGEALASVPVLSQEERGKRFLISDAVRALDADEFAPVIDAPAIGPVDAFIGEITRTFVRQYLANAGSAAIPFVHTVTAPSSLRIIAPHIGDDAARQAARYAWQACASIYGAYSGNPVPDTATATPDEADLIDRAVAARDEHAIKFTEACLREYRISGDSAFIAGILDATTRLRAD